MNLLLLDQFSDPGGAQQCLADLLPAMAWRGWRGTLAAPGDGVLFRQAHEAGFATEQLRCGPYASGRKTIADWRRFLSDTPRLAGHIRAMAQRTAADLIYVNGPRLLPAAALARSGRSVLFHSHSYLPPGLLRQAAGISLDRMEAHVVAACEFLAEPWRKFLEADRVRVIYNGVRGPVRLSARRQGGPPRIGCIGRISPEKGQRDFIAAAKRIHRSLPKCNFSIYGAALFGDSEAAQYQADVRRDAEGLPVEFAGWVSETYGAMASLDLLLVPSKGHEATTRVVLEAFAAGVPVIAYPSGGIREVIQNNVNGLLAHDADQMADLAIMLLSGDPRRMISLSCHARVCWEDRFHIERYQQGILQLIETVVGLSMPAGMGR